jgi:hypothetical protein
VGIFWLAAACLAAIQSAGWAQGVQHLSITQPGGMPGLPIMTGISAGTNNVTLSWDGPGGYYQIFQTPDINARFQAIGKATNLVRTATISAIYNNAFFKVSGPAPSYAGALACSGCHAAIHNNELNTKHAQAFETLRAIGQHTNASCLPCHTVGYGLPTGFISEAATPRLEGVQCENCHGPAANHAGSETDPVYRPRIEIASQVCGGCHNGDNHPTFDEWASSPHVGVVEDMNATNRIDSCGRCHSGNARLSLLKNRPLPYGDANIGIVCTVCHDPHQTNANPAQLRNPVFSTNDYFITTSAPFTNQYQADINGCAQCHNHRGADWTSSSRPPHNSAQYNALLGTVGLITNQPPMKSHSHARRIANQCAGCHMQTTGTLNGLSTSTTGHGFEVTQYGACTPCHGSSGATLVQNTQSNTLQLINQLTASLNNWAMTKAPPSLWTNYGYLAWEYSTPGDLSSGSAGPTSSEQALIPDNIKKARFNLYLVYNEGSLGVHNNKNWTLPLLYSGMDWVAAELGPLSGQSAPAAADSKLPGTEEQ